MKFLFSLFIILSMTKDCNNKTNSLEENSAKDTEVTSEINKLQEDITFEYSALSRGLYNRVVITHSTIFVQRDRNSKAISKPCNKDDWSSLMNLLNTIDLKNISNLEAPTQARLYDGAAIAQLKIVHEGATYETNSFDHGKPPLEIDLLVKKILSLSENIE